MQIVIDLSSDTVTRLCHGEELLGHRLQEVFNAVKHGTPLPEDHGRIIDVDKVEVTKILNPKHEYTKGINAGVDHVINAIYNAPAIIEATGVKE